MADTNILIKMMAEVGKAVNDLKKVDKGMANIDKQAKKTASGVAKFGGSITKMMGALGIGMSIALVARKIVQFGKESVETASRVEELGMKFDVVFGDKANEARQQLDEFANTVNRSTVDLQEMSAEGQNVLVALGVQRDAAAEYSIGLTKLAVDVAAFQNAQDADVLNSFTSAMVGNHIAAKKFGVILNDASLSQELFNMGVTGGMEAATEAEKAIARYNIILDRTADSHGAAEKEAGSYANVTKGLDAAMLDLKATIGAALLPSMVELKKTQTELIRGLTENIERTMLLDRAEQANILTKKELRRAAYSVGDADKYSNEQLTELWLNYEKSQISIINMSTSYEDYVRIAKEVNGTLVEMTELQYAEIVASQEAMATDARQTENLLAQKEAMDDIKFGMNSLAKSKKDYTEKTEDLQKEAAELNGILSGQISLWNSDYDSIGEVNEALDENTQKQTELAAQLDETTSKLIYQAIAADLDADTALALARGLGLLDEQSYLLGKSIKDTTDDFIAQGGEADDLVVDITKLKDAYLSIDGLSVDTHINEHRNVYTSGIKLSGYGGVYAGGIKLPGYAEGADFTVPYSASGGDYFPFQGMLAGGEQVSITPKGKGSNEQLLKEMQGLRNDLKVMGAGASAIDIATAMRDELQQVLG